ncbi:MAG: hypothetical protein JW860_14605 [Sedimentisphaerales bacterium]|nr:hypothetical protein [Sedimentisphaerales bacterium]
MGQSGRLRGFFKEYSLHDLRPFHLLIMDAKVVGLGSLNTTVTGKLKSTVNSPELQYFE